MATSKEPTVRNVIVGAIRGVASSLGFDETNGNVKDYLLEWEEASLVDKYLMADVGGRRQVRVWGVEVVANDDWYAAGNITRRTYTIKIQGFESLGINGAGVNAIIDGARIVRGAIRSLGSRLSNTVDLVNSTGEIRLDRISGFNADQGELIKGTMTYVAERANPDF
jgi:hypothetical protein